MYDPGIFWAAFGAAWVFGCATILVVIWHLRSKRNIEKMQIAHEERMKAMEKGVPLPEFPELKEGQSRIEITPMKLNPRWPLGVGALCVFAGVGYTVAMLLSGDNELFKLWSMGMIGVFFGFGLMLFYYLTRAPEKK